MVNDHAGGEGVWVQVSAWTTFYRAFNFSINDHSKYENISKLIRKKKYSIILKLFYISLDYCCEFTYFNRPTYLLNLIL